MMPRKNEILGHVSYIVIGDNPPVRWDSLTDEKREEYSAHMMERVNRTIFDHFVQHPEELEAFINGLKECNECEE